MTTRRGRRDALVPARAHAAVSPQPSRHPAPAPSPRWSRRRGVVAVFAAFAALGFVAASVGPTGMALADATAGDDATTSLYASTIDDAQSLEGDASAETKASDLGRDSYSVYVKPKPTPTPVAAAATTSTTSGATGWAPPAVAPNPGSAQAIAHEMVLARGWGENEYNCLVSLWSKESGWRVNAYNAGSGAYGIPQALPGSKMASAGADWATNPATQITWGLGYITGRYGTPCGAWAKSQSSGWY
ncbi:lytic transglycosylase domain-containing protein [Microbacterium terricola]|nr:lytic transglycosylase domain-containing protein [Microbacterium terricola]UYK41399.1 lytic transglycosylase domain-containing protein [Microbacterium terricola]